MTMSSYHRQNPRNSRFCRWRLLLVGAGSVRRSGDARMVCVVQGTMTMKCHSCEAAELVGDTRDIPCNRKAQGIALGIRSA